LFELHFSRVTETLNLTPTSLVRPLPILVTMALLGLVLFATAALAGPPRFYPPAPTEALLAQRSFGDVDSLRATNPPKSLVAVDSTRAPIDTTAALADSTTKAPPDSALYPLPAIKYGNSMGKAVLFDALIPGSGHLYAGYKSGWINLGVEGLTWAAYFYYHGQGTTKENQYLTFADSNWSYQTWISSGCSECYAGSDADKLIQQFMAENKQHFYEDIGKIPTYWYGWEDYNTTIPNDSQVRKDYYHMRDESNKDLHNANYALMVGLVNRVVAVADIIRLMKKAPKVNIGNGTSLQFNVHTKPFSSDNAFGLAVSKKL
jgi:hypothetical protein